MRQHAYSQVKELYTDIQKVAQLYYFLQIFFYWSSTSEFLQQEMNPSTDRLQSHKDWENNQLH